MSSYLRPLFQHAHAYVEAMFCGELLKSNGGRESGGARADDHDVVFQRFALRHLDLRNGPKTFASAVNCPASMPTSTSERVHQFGAWRPIKALLLKPDALYLFQDPPRDVAFHSTDRGRTLRPCLRSHLQSASGS